jgi:spermidine synthase
MNRELVYDSAAVKAAIGLGWHPAPWNRKAKRYFSFYGPERFTVIVTPSGELSFTVGHQSTTHQPQAINWLQTAAGKSIKERQCYT